MEYRNQVKPVQPGHSSGILVEHNHPSGNPAPSSEDHFSFIEEVRYRSETAPDRPSQREHSLAFFFGILLLGTSAFRNGEGSDVYYRMDRASRDKSEKMNYEQAVEETWRHRALEGAFGGQKTLVAYATLAASSHNTQPWKFRLEPDCISILPNFSRRCPEVDPDDHHLFVSLGCATENLVLAARAAGLNGTATYEPGPDPGGAVRVRLEKATPSQSPLFDAIPHRRCSRTSYDGQGVESNELAQLAQAGSRSGVDLLLLTDDSKKDSVAGYVAEGNRAQIGVPRWAAELRSWVRFIAREAVRFRDGLYAGCIGSPSVPRFLGELFMRFALSPKSQSAKDVANIRSSAGIAVFVSDVDDIPHWIEAGRCYQRFALQATALGIKNAFVNQPVEVSRLRQEFAYWLGVPPRRPDLVVRFGRGGPEMPHSLRRPVREVIL